MIDKCPLISILIPVYNAQRFLAECLASICNQTYRNLEIICIDDGSCDDSAAILNNYAKQDKRIKVIHQKRSGVASTRTNLLREIKGEFFAFVDSDDKLDSDYISSLFEAAQTQQADVVRCLYYLQNVNDETIVSCEQRYKEFLRPAPDSSYKARFQAALDDTQVWLKLIKTSLVKKNKLSFLKNVLAEDISFEILLYLYAKKIVFLDKHLYFYRVGNEKSVSSNKGLWARGTLENMAYLCHELQKRHFTASDIYNQQAALTLQAVRRLRKFPPLPGDGNLYKQALLAVKEISRYCSCLQKCKYRFFCRVALGLPALWAPQLARFIR
ncbi:glycosyltransferase family 2 protein [Candidatus Avelusimicrobium faecicola]|uniref:glycosyltransferase family 2 protein n=1 Tax=Candidatus Avelusimicrobium faecicola TaxID=3416205 RepID=UPI003CA525F5|nr:glycosyltransferase [Spirochaetota bacterium]